MSKVAGAAEDFIVDRHRFGALEAGCRGILKAKPWYARYSVTGGSAESGSRSIQPMLYVYMPGGAATDADIYRVCPEMGRRRSRLVGKYPVVALGAPLRHRRAVGHI
jgi:hypothetical protein